MDSPRPISITTGTFIRLLVVAAAAYAVWILRDLALLVITAVVIASALEPGTAFFMRYKFPRVLAVLVMYLAVFGTLFSVVYFMVPPILNDTQSFIASLPEYLETVDLPAELSGFTQTPFFSADTGGTASSMLDTVLTFRSEFASGSDEAIQLVSAFFGGVFALLLVVVLSFYFAIQETGVEQFLRLVTPQKHEKYIVGLWNRAKVKIGLWMQGQLVLSLITGVIVYLGLLLLGVPYALLLAVLAAMFDLVPIFGSLIAGVVAVIVALGAGGIPLALLVAGLYIIVNQFQANLIYPLVVNKVVGIPPLLVILALVAGGALAGFLGVLLAVPVAAALREFLDDVDRGKRSQTSA
jgi:predicted PurR-regulated permease PerM